MARLDDLSELSKLLFMPRLFCPQQQLFFFPPLSLLLLLTMGIAMVTLKLFT